MLCVSCGGHLKKKREPVGIRSLPLKKGGLARASMLDDGIICSTRRSALRNLLQALGSRPSRNSRGFEREDYDDVHSSD